MFEERDERTAISMKKGGDKRGEIKDSFQLAQFSCSFEAFFYVF